MVKIKEDISWIGVNDRVTDLFEGVWPIPEGVSYNSYLIEDEKIALIDSVKSCFEDEFIENIEELVDPRDIDYIIVNHMEPDHSGALPTIRKLAPEAKIICTKKAVSLLESFYGFTDNIHPVREGDTLDLGKRELKFFETPFVHWPESMVTYETSERVLFSNDAFGGFGALEGGNFDDEVNLDYYEDQILRYFSNIVGAYSAPVQAALEKLSDLDIEIIAPSHGPIWRSEPNTIVKLYDKWSRLEGEKGVTLIYGSMYGNTSEMMEAVARGLKSKECTNIKILDASRVHMSYLLSESWRRKGLIIGTPTYDGRIFPPVDHFVQLARKKKLKDRVVGLFGSFGWSGGALDRVKSVSEQLNWNLIEPICEFNGKPTNADLKRGKELGEKIIERVFETCENK